MLTPNPVSSWLRLVGSFFEMGTVAAWPLGQHGAAEQWAMGIENTVRITNDPLAFPPQTIRRFLLRFHLESDRRKLVMARSKGISMPP